MIWLMAIFAAQVSAQAQATIVTPVAMRGSHVESIEIPQQQPAHVRACDNDQPPTCRMVIIDLP